MPRSKRQPKPWWASKTLWANGAVGLSVLLLTPELREVLGPDALKWIAVLQAGLNIFLRVITAAPIEGTPAAKRTAG